MASILVPTDFSEQAGFALDLAAQLAKQENASLQILHVVEQPGSYYLTAVGGGAHDQIDNVYVLKLIERVKVQLNSLVSKLTNEGIDAKYRIKIGNPFKHISEEIQGESIDLIVMGTQGISGIDEVLVGSNTEKVIRHAACPVITLKTAVDLEKLDNLVFAIGQYAPFDHMALQLKTIQAWFGAKAHLVTINTPNSFLVERAGIKRLAEFVAEYEVENYSINVYSEITEEEGILHFAEDIEADAIVMGTHGRTGISRLLAGSLSEKMVNHSKTPVITFPLVA